MSGWTEGRYRRWSILHMKFFVNKPIWDLNGSLSIKQLCVLKRERERACLLFSYFLSPFYQMALGTPYRHVKSHAHHILFGVLNLMSRLTLLNTFQSFQCSSEFPQESLCSLARIASDAHWQSSRSLHGTWREVALGEGRKGVWGQIACPYPQGTFANI